MLETLRCSHCGRLVSPTRCQVDYFDLLQGGRRSFEVDQTALKRRFLGWQRKMHPDRFAHRAADREGAAEAQRAALWSATINKAYETLRSDLSRAIYLYNLAAPGDPYDEECSGSSMAEEDLLGFLELREHIEAAEAVSRVDEILQEVRQMVEGTRGRLSRALGQSSDMSQDRRQLLGHTIDRLKFLETIREAAEARHHQLSRGQ